MRLIKKSNPPGLLVTYCKQTGASYDSMDRHVKDAVVLALLEEQGWVCGYCQQTLTRSQISIEHFCERHICKDKTLDYTNLMAVCPGHSKNDLHCDKMKANFTTRNGLPMEVCPWNPAHMNGIRYHSSGVVDSTNARHKMEMDSILNLNASYLKNSRREKMKRIFELSKGPVQGYNKTIMRRILKKTIERGGGKFSEDFPGLLEYMLRKYC